jgi:broad specificity phosphatase PhoE
MVKDEGKIVYFVRHGQSEDNALPVFQSKESPLSELGKKQAEKIAHRISRISFEKLLASPLVRARETAQVISGITGKEPEYSELFVERMKPTLLYGKSHEDAEAKKLDEEWRSSLYKTGMRAEDGENFDDLVARADKALDFLANRIEDRLVVVTHGYFLRTMVARVLLGGALTPEAFRNFQRRVLMENTGLSAMKFAQSSNGKIWRLWIYNDHTHLG